MAGPAKEDEVCDVSLADVSKVQMLEKCPVCELARNPIGEGKETSRRRWDVWMHPLLAV